MFIRIKDSDGDMRLVNADKIVNIFVWDQTQSRIVMDPDICCFYSTESVTDIDQKLYRAGLINN